MTIHEIKHSEPFLTIVPHESGDFCGTMVFTHYRSTTGYELMDNLRFHLKNILSSEDLLKDAVAERISVTASGSMNYFAKSYKLNIVVSYCVNSIRATQFRQWATNVLRQFAIRGSLLDSKRMENYGKNYLS